MVGQITGRRVEQYRHRHPIWRSTLVPCLIAILVMGAFHLYGRPAPRAIADVVAAMIIVAIARAAFISLRGTWESWIDGNVLFWRLPGRTQSSIQLAKLNEVVEVDFPNEDRAKEFELVLNDGRRVVLDSRLIQFKEFRAAIYREMPAVVFGSRNGKLCYACGEDLRVRKDRCPACGVAIPEKSKSFLMA
jgi:hypothetical protein